MYEPVMENGVWRIWRNNELEQACREPLILSEMEIERIIWIRHVQTVTEEIVFHENVPRQTRWKKDKRKNQGMSED